MPDDKKSSRRQGGVPVIEFDSCVTGVVMTTVAIVVPENSSDPSIRRRKRVIQEIGSGSYL